MTDKKQNPFDIEPDAKVEPKTDGAVVETSPEKAGTKQDKPTEPVSFDPPAKKESAERAMADTEKRVAPVRIMVREKAVAGPWREA